MRPKFGAGFFTGALVTTPALWCLPRPAPQPPPPGDQETVATPSALPGSSFLAWASDLQKQGLSSAPRQQVAVGTGSESRLPLAPFPGPGATAPPLPGLSLLGAAGPPAVLGPADQGKWLSSGL